MIKSFCHFLMTNVTLFSVKIFLVYWWNEVLQSTLLLIGGYLLTVQKEAWLHITNVYGSIPIGHSTTLKEKYDAIRSVLQHIKYNDQQWLICVDLKMMNFLLGQWSGYTKYPFFCYLDSSDKANHWNKKDWSVRDRLSVGEKNVTAEQLLPRGK